MKKIFLLLAFAITFFANAQFTPSTGVNYVKFLKTPPTGALTSNYYFCLYNDTDKFMYKVAADALGTPTLDEVLGEGNTSDNDFTLTNGTQTMHLQPEQMVSSNTSGSATVINPNGVNVGDGTFTGIHNKSYFGFSDEDTPNAAEYGRLSTSITDGTSTTEITKTGISSTSNGASANHSVQGDGTTVTFYGETSDGSSVTVGAANGTGGVIGGTFNDASYTIDGSLLTGSNSFVGKIPNKNGTFTLATLDDITGGGSVQSVTGAIGEISVDNTDPSNPIVGLETNPNVQGTLTVFGDTSVQETLIVGLNANIAGNVTAANISGTNTGDQTTVTGNAGTATALQTARTIGTITGDATSAGSSFNGTANNTNALTLATVNSNVGTFGSATQVPVFTVNGKGLITGVTNTSISLPTMTTGAVSSTDNAIARFDGATGKVIQNSSVTIDDNGAITVTGEASPTFTAKTLKYDTTLNQWIAYDNDSSVSLNVGYETWFLCANNTGSTIPNGSVVYISGTSSGTPTIALAKADAASTSVGIGITTEAIANGATGKVTQSGLVNGMDTSGLSAGAVYVSATTAGALTNTAPVSPNYRMRVGFVGAVNASTGTVLVTPSTAALGNGLDGQVLSIGATGSQEWKPMVYYLRQVSDRAALTANTSAQNIFDVNSGSMTVPEGLYKMTVVFFGTGFSSTTGFVSFGLAGTATYATAIYNSYLNKTAAAAGGATVSPLMRTSATAQQVTLSNVNTFVSGTIEGMVSISTGGTVIPQITMSVGSAAVIQHDTAIFLQRIGANASTTNN